MIGGVLSRQVGAIVSKNVVRVPVRTIYPHKSSNHIAGMPRVRIPFMEKALTGVFIVSGILATPMWILTHLDDYRGGPAE